MKQIAIIGPTASGKSDLAIAIAQQMNAYILSIDSLSLYKEIDIVSAKPSREELAQIKHYGINELFVNEYFSVDIFIDLYKKVRLTCKEDNKNLVIVGGTSFYLKSLIEGLSSLPNISPEHSLHVTEQLQDLDACYKFLTKIDAEYMQKIAPNDKYRMEKALLIYEASRISPSEWFRQNLPKPVITDVKIYNIDVSREVLRERIANRTHKMYEKGLIDEICFLEQKYTRAPHAMGAIGIVEVLDYLDGKADKDAMLSLISTHTAQLAKRQQTFNRTQFSDITSAKLEDLQDIILDRF
ncbi:tRNA (adenosine(37)-N6)-dimethylallyltransferase MiaA [Sulfurimonas autotrophica]|uniref:tRNA dimethylallyltransferase n=1 Tax=Sulfurimonas autotrophica (strain ATCC BAA-671 / DSM 16294 / JCM 11897 / OK10) TaxID=563040 RepID=E0UUJ5_SULAO|nr:tRNA (adenosine(37)-N6)-dimethylallyltransferase MiaA [Sulfurimonas autotrophica]ADN08431.1 tRNA delta(2)-isopentenylpyrophosphate transferase [Sulfurimonas autotrophica DSM 16294]